MSPALKGVGFVDAVRTVMHELFEAARGIDIRQFEEERGELIAQHLSPQVVSLLERAISVASNILARYEDVNAAAAGNGELNFDLAVDNLLAQTGHPKVADLAFMAVAELRQRLARVRTHGPELDAWEMVCDCGSALRRVQKSLSALELALCEAENLPRVLDFHSELETSLQTRRQYRKLWRFVAGLGAVGPEGVRNALRGAGTLCAMLVGRDVYCRLRERDRYQLRQLQRRILAWLVQESGDPKAGLRVWEDYAGFVEMLRQVSLRQELVQNDGEALRIAEQSLAICGESGLTGVLAVLRRVEGLDDGLDAALALDPPDRKVLHAETRRVRARFLSSESPPPFSSSDSSTF
ncbi:MAG: hypothetical protein Q8L48_39090 [Archangium sp.]|nr:hypothetical protein [Archangium sp.]